MRGQRPPRPGRGDGELCAGGAGGRSIPRNAGCGPCYGRVPAPERRRERDDRDGWQPRGSAALLLGLVIEGGEVLVEAPPAPCTEPVEWDPGYQPGQVVTVSADGVF